MDRLQRDGAVREARIRGFQCIHTCRYVKWTQEHLTGSGKQELQAVLEACTQEVARHERYVTDVRFLRVWIQYVSGKINKAGFGVPRKQASPSWCCRINV